jgi:hypothetical protein
MPSHYFPGADDPPPEVNAKDAPPTPEADEAFLRALRILMEETEGNRSDDDEAPELRP